MVEIFRQYIFDAQFHKPRYFNWRRIVTRQLLTLLMDKAPVFFGTSDYSQSGIPYVLKTVATDIKRNSVICLNIQNIPIWFKEKAGVKREDGAKVKR